MCFIVNSSPLNPSTMILGPTAKKSFSRTTLSNLWNPYKLLKIAMVSSLALLAPASATAQPILQKMSKVSSDDQCSMLSPSLLLDRCALPNAKNALRLDPMATNYLLNYRVEKRDQDGLDSFFSKALFTHLEKKPELFDRIQQWQTVEGHPVFSNIEEFSQNSCIYYEQCSRCQKTELCKQSKSMTSFFEADFESFLDDFESALKTQKYGHGIILKSYDSDSTFSMRPNLVEQTLFRTFNLDVATVKDGQDLCQLVQKARERAGKRLDFVLINTHGTPRQITLGNEILRKEDQQRIANCIKDNLAKDAPIILESCSAAAKYRSMTHEGVLKEEPGFAESLAKKTGRRVMAPAEDIQPFDCDVVIEQETHRISAFNCHSEKITKIGQLTGQGFGKTFP